jgi:hypothetical protein
MTAKARLGWVISLVTYRVEFESVGLGQAR